MPGGPWWLARLLAFRQLKYAIEHEQPIDALADDATWDSADGW